LQVFKGEAHPSPGWKFRSEKSIIGKMKKKGETMKILFTSDLHGEIALYRQIPDVVRRDSCEILILGGDLLPSLQRSRSYEEMFTEQRAFIRSFLLPFFREALRAEFQRIFLIPGNWDPAYGEIFSDPVEGVVDLDRKSFRLENGYEFIGYPFVPPTPFRPKDYEKRDDPDSPWPPQKNPSYIRSPKLSFGMERVDPLVYLRGNGTIAEDLKNILPSANQSKTLWVMHSPPFQTNLDVIHGGRPVGSRSIRRFIEAFQPFLTLHGHIHEAPRVSGKYADWIGNTLCINPGQLLSEDEGFPRLQGVVFDLYNPEETFTHTALKRA
jgi:uncharacterized protein